MNSTPSWHVHVAPSAGRKLARLNPKDQRLIRAAFAEMETNPRAGDVVALTNQPAAFRRRVGNWRLFFDLYPEQQLVDVVAIERRTSTTYRKR